MNIQFHVQGVKATEEEMVAIGKLKETNFVNIVGPNVKPLKGTKGWESTDLTAFNATYSPKPEPKAEEPVAPVKVKAVRRKRTAKKVEDEIFG